MSFMQKKFHSKKTNSNYSTTEMFINWFMLGHCQFFKRLQQKRLCFKRILKSCMPRSLSFAKLAMLTFGDPLFILFLDKVSDIDAFISFGMRHQDFGT